MNRTGGHSGHASDCVVTVPPRLAWLRQWWSRVVAGLAFAVVAGVTGRVSYLHIEDLTLALHQPAVVARLMPFGVDGLIVVGSVALLQAPDDQWWLGWLCVGPGAAASLFANVESGLRYGPLAAAWAGMASAGFFLATFTLERWLKAQAAEAHQAARGGPEAVAAMASDSTPDASAQDGGAPDAGGPEGGEDEPAGPPDPEAALRALIESGSRRAIASLLGVPKVRVDRWAADFRAAEESAARPAQDEGQDEAPEDAPGMIPEPSPNGSAPDA